MVHAKLFIKLYVGPIDKNVVAILTSIDGPQDVDPSDGLVDIGVESGDKISKDIGGGLTPNIRVGSTSIPCVGECSRGPTMCDEENGDITLAELVVSLDLCLEEASDEDYVPDSFEESAEDIDVYYWEEANKQADKAEQGESNQRNGRTQECAVEQTFNLVGP